MAYLGEKQQQELPQPPASLLPASTRGQPQGPAAGAGGASPRCLPGASAHPVAHPGFTKQQKATQVHEPSPRSRELPLPGPDPPAQYPHPCREPPPAPVQCGCGYSCGASSPSCCHAPRALGGCSAAEPPTLALGLSTSLQLCRVSPDGRWALPCFPQPLAGQCLELKGVWKSRRCIGRALWADQLHRAFHCGVTPAPQSA